jgi:hypothetical protein
MKAGAEHLAINGEKDWHKVRDRFPDVPETTLWRWVKAPP